MRRRSRAKQGPPVEWQFAEALADTMFALSTPSRVQILFCLLEQPHDVSQLTEAIGMEQSAISHQLRVLRELALVRVDRDGSRRVYGLFDDHVAALLREGARHVERRQRGRGSGRATGKRTG
jgi:ArsR family transcriptional regulator, nickel/cobalt-responsive transcriptional repressor